VGLRLGSYVPHLAATTRNVVSRGVRHSRAAPECTEAPVSPVLLSAVSTLWIGLIDWCGACRPYGDEHGHRGDKRSATSGLHVGEHATDGRHGRHVPVRA
jgi:hypothetical protein